MPITVTKFSLKGSETLQYFPNSAANASGQLNIFIVND